ncbi:hypothetical protein ACFSUS_28280 [Spirosoma soli]|uniref:DUF4595 domain-containing protein n=1 Tax=Spirosoma soli TaxID=1770529 RepID=A0ABW5MDV6_9BACT
MPVRKIVEARFSTKDSLTVTYYYNPLGRLTKVEFPKWSNRLPILCLYNEPDISSVKDKDRFVNYKLFDYDKAQQLIRMRRYFLLTDNAWFLYETDSLLYNDGRLEGLYHNDYVFVSDAAQVAFRYPLWLTRRSYEYDPQGRIVLQTDSVFRTHDYPAHTVVIQPIPKPIYLHIDRTEYNYNEHNQVIRKRAYSIDKNRLLTYSNGTSIYVQPDNNWTTYNLSLSAQFLEETTTYEYKYKADSLLVGKQANYQPTTDSKVYTNIFTYEY